MKAITLHQPWASLIAHGVKVIETRSWAPPRSYLGNRIAVHAGRRVVRHRLHPEVWYAVEGIYGAEWWKVVPTGAVVCTAVLTDARQVKRCPGSAGLHLTPSLTGATQGLHVEADFYGDFRVDRWLWFLAGVEVVAPPARAIGHQGFWDWVG